MKSRVSRAGFASMGPAKSELRTNTLNGLGAENESPRLSTKNSSSRDTIFCKLPHLAKRNAMRFPDSPRQLVSGRQATRGKRFCNCEELRTLALQQ